MLKLKYIATYLLTIKEQFWIVLMEGSTFPKQGKRKRHGISKVAGQQKYLCQIHPTVVEPTFKQTFPPVS